MDGSLSTTLLHAITFLLSPLAPHFQSQTLDTLHLALLSALSSYQTSADYSQTLHFARNTPAPAPIQFALNALSTLPPSYRVSFQDWHILLSGGNQVILTIVPGFVQAAVRNPLTKELVYHTIWDASVQRRAPSPWGSSSRSRSSAPSSSGSGSESSRSSSPAIETHVALSPAVAVSAAENVLRGFEDDDDDLVFLKTQSRSPANGWLPESKFPTPISSTSFKSKPKTAAAALHPSPFVVGASRPRAEYQHHSRSSSRSSTVSSGAPSLVSIPSTSASSAAHLANSLSALSLSSRNHARANSSSLSLTLSNASTLSSSPEPPSPTPSMDDEEPTCYIDSTKTQTAVTEYECGKVGVLTGAVMLGVPSHGKAKAVPSGIKSQKTTSTSPVQPPRGGTQGFKPSPWRRNSAVRI